MDKKSLSSAFLTAVLIGLFLASIMSFTTVKAATEVSGIISSDITWTTAKSPYTLTGNILVNDGVTLTIQPDVTINLGDYYILVNGTLVAKGTIDNPIHFNGGSITFTGFSVSWNGQIEEGCIVENAIFSSTSVSSSGSVKISKSSLNAGISGEGRDIISENNIEGEVSGGLITGNTITGDVKGNTVSNSIITGTVSGDVIANSIITGGVKAIGNCLVSNNTITDGIAGIGIGILIDAEFGWGSGGYPTIENNLIANTNIGISIGVLIRDWFSANIPQIQRNLITKNSVGIKYSISVQNPYGDRKPTTIQDNTISQNNIGIKFAGNVEQITIQNNNMQDNSEYNLHLEDTPNNVDATHNWWGTTKEQAISQSIYDFEDDFHLGKVAFTPFLTEPNPSAKLDPYGPAPPPTPLPSPLPTTSPAQLPESTPTQEPQQTLQFEAIVGAVIAVTVIGAGLFLLIYLIIRK